MSSLGTNTKVLFLGKKDDLYCEKAFSIVKETFPNTISYLAEWGDEWPKELNDWEGDIVISYLSRWIIPQKVLSSAKKMAINYHPAPPEYPGVGCTNFALYNDESTYGCTCHHMDSTVDTGEIIKVARFEVEESDTVETLLLKTYEHQFELFKETFELIKNDTKIEPSNESWKRKPYTRKELNELSKITLGMDRDEVKRRVRATNYRNFKPTIEVEDLVFELKGQ